jgi:hypothetical protein
VTRHGAPSAISVGAVDTKNTLTRADDEVAAFSSRGPTCYDGYAKPDVVNEEVRSKEKDAATAVRSPMQTHRPGS